MTLKTYDQWKRGDEPEPEHICRDVDNIPKEIIRDEIDKEILDNLRESALESEEITEKPRKFSRVNIFKEQDWCKIKGVRAKLAKKLVENGPYMSIKEIAKVKGVGKTILENIKATLLDYED